MSTVKRKSVVDRILEEINQQIKSGIMVPGEKIPTEMELCETFQVGRNSLREAMKILSALGVMEIRQGDGTYLRKDPQLTSMDAIAYTMILKQSTVEEIFELREKMESNLLELAVKKATGDDIKGLKNILERHLKLIESEDYDEIEYVDVEFHEKIANIARNPILKRMAENVYNLFAASIGDTLRGRGQYIKAFEYHSEMVNAIQYKNAQFVVDIVERSLEEWRKQMEEIN